MRTELAKSARTYKSLAPLKPERSTGPERPASDITTLRFTAYPHQRPMWTGLVSQGDVHNSIITHYHHDNTLTSGWQ